MNRIARGIRTDVPRVRLEEFYKLKLCYAVLKDLRAKPPTLTTFTSIESSNIFSHGPQATGLELARLLSGFPK
jgi:hypothetical protein